MPGRRIVGLIGKLSFDRRPVARSSRRSASSALMRWAGSLRSRPLSTGLSGPALRAGGGFSVASAASVAIADGRANGEAPSTAA